MFQVLEQQSPLSIGQPLSYEILSNFFIYNINYLNCKYQKIIKKLIFFYQKMEFFKY